MAANNLTLPPLILIFISLSTSFSHHHPHYQTLVLTSLPSSPPLSWPPETELETGIESSGSSSNNATTNAPLIMLHLYHRDSLTFNETPEALFSLRLARDKARVKSLTAAVTAAVKLYNAPKIPADGRDFSSSVISGLTQGSGEYFTRLGVGTPAKYLYMVLDTGSDIIWIQCAPCKKCYSQTDPVFDPRKSSSFARVTCRSKMCTLLDSPGCSKNEKCQYQVAYGDGSSTVGQFLTETLTFRKTRVKRVGIGCGHDNEGLFSGAAGLLGLGRGKLSFPGQTGERFGSKFSYCLVDRSGSTKPSSVMFGESSVSKKVVYTPLIKNPKIDTFYYLDLIGVSVGGARVRSVTASLFKLNAAGDGGIIIDSGTSVTRLTRPAYLGLRDAFRRAANLKKSGAFSLFDTCYDLSGQSSVSVPTIVFHFRGASVSLPASNYLIPVDDKSKFCFAFAGTTSGLSIIGNIQQQGFRVVFDIAKSRVGFAPHACA